jgi:hypothetical protein
LLWLRDTQQAQWSGQTVHIAHPTLAVVCVAVRNAAAVLERCVHPSVGLARKPGATCVAGLLACAGYCAESVCCLNIQLQISTSWNVHAVLHMRPAGRHVCSCTLFAVPVLCWSGLLLCCACATHLLCTCLHCIATHECVSYAGHQHYLRLSLPLPSTRVPLLVHGALHTCAFRSLPCWA